MIVNIVSQHIYLFSFDDDLSYFRKQNKALDFS
jgi:hypothetical protein